MSIQDIAVSNGQKKSLLKAINDVSIALQEDEGEVIVNTQAYIAKYPKLAESPVYQIVENETFDTDVEYWVFS
jgi:hypothetical protein